MNKLLKSIAFLILITLISFPTFALSKESETLKEALSLHSNKKYEQAFVLFEKEAHKGNAQAQYILGQIYQRGIGTDKDEELAIHWYKKASKQKFSAASYNLGAHYDREAWLTTHAPLKNKRYKIAFDWFKTSAEQGNTDAIYKVGEYFLFGGQGVPKDYKQAAEWFKKAVDKSHPEAYYQLSRLYYHGHGVTKDFDKAADLSKKAANYYFNKGRK